MSGLHHNSNRTVRDYLLETASAGDMVSFEDKYFTDPAFLKLVEIEEERLIEDYLLGRLEQNSKKRFEEIYRRDTRLGRKVNEARLQNNARTRAGGYRLWMYAIPALMACIGMVAFFLSQAPSTEKYEAKLETPSKPPFIDIRLTPGLSKGISGPATPAIVPSGKSRLRMTFEMPGVVGPVSCRAKLLRIEENGSQKEIAFTALSSSNPGRNSEAVFIFDTISTLKGDYIAELITPNGSVLERYLFQVR